MAFTVRFTQGARTDLRSIHTYIATNDSVESADHVAREIVRAALTLKELPQRGTYPPELATLGNHTYRQIFFKPYRILYRIRGNVVHIAVIADGRRDMASVLMRRMHQA
jgi:toxin ParE1/3/4